MPIHCPPHRHQRAAFSNNPTPISFDAGLGPIYVSGQLTGLAFLQSNPQHEFPGDSDHTLDLTNGQIEVQKTDGLIQFYVQAGLYSFPTVRPAL